MADALRKRMVARRITWAAAVLSIGAVAAALVAAIGSGQGAWPFRDGFMVLRYAFFAAVAGGLLAIVAWAMARRGDGSLALLNLVALVVALLFVGFVGKQVATARSVPAIHDVTTNLDDPPVFYRLALREDNLAEVPDGGRPELARLTPWERWKALHREAYGDLHTIRVSWDLAETMRRAEALAKDRGWEVASVDPRGIIEATDTSLFFRFKDDIVIRARPDPAGGTAVDMRSVSRVGVSDVGVNAKRVRGFLKDLQAG